MAKISKQSKKYSIVYRVNMGDKIDVTDFSDVPKDRFVYGIPKNPESLTRHKTQHLLLTKQANTLVRILFDGELPVFGKPMAYQINKYDWYDCTFDLVLSQKSDRSSA